MNPYEKYKGFTEGPWRVEPQEAIGCRNIQFLRYPNRKSSWKWDGLGMTDGISDDNEDKANAELFAAAPLLLQDCREMWETLNEMNQRFQATLDGTSPLIENLLNRIKERHNG